MICSLNQSRFQEKSGATAAARFGELARPGCRVEKLVYESAEGQLNLALAGGHGQLYTVFDASKVLTANCQLLSTWLPPFAHRRIKAGLRRIVRALIISPVPCAGRNQKKK